MITRFVSELSGSAFGMYGNVTDYFYLKNANELLKEENIRLRMQLQNAYYKHDVEQFSFHDTIKELEYIYTPAHVIRNTINRKSNYVMIDKGSRHGIEKNMGVLSSNGVVGYVINTSPRFSWVLPVLNKDFRFSVKVKKNNQMGTLLWDGKDYRYGIVNHIPGHVNLKKGDTIISSGFSDNVPEGIPVGSVEDFNIISGEDFYKVKIKFFTDYNRLYDVYLVKNMMKPEQDSVQLKRL